MKKLTKMLGWIDEHLLQIIVTGFIFIIPLYPKFPLKFITYTYVSIRLEDLYVAFAVISFFIQVLRKKVTLNKKFVVLFLLFWAAIFASYLTSVFITKTMPYRQLALLHTLRRVEYLSLFLIASSAIKNRKEIFFYFKVLLLVLVIVAFYGIGQKFLGFPAVQTMNPEFAKGYVLYLTPEARISSTFSGHYDLAAYLVFLMPQVLGIYFWQKKMRYFLIFVLSLFIIVLTASRISYIAYLLSVIAFLIFLRKPKTLLAVILITVILTYLSKNLTSRFFKTFQVKQIFVNEKTGQVVVPQRITAKELPAGTFYVTLNKNTPATKSNQQFVRQEVLSDIIKQASSEGKILSSSEAAALAATYSANLKPFQTVVSDISFATRLQVEWPRAIKAFFSYPILGKGPATITEATDNDYLRSLGEFGILGSTAIAAILLNIFLLVFKSIPKLNEDIKPIYYGFLFGMGGLLINASYIDVFEASKVAYHFWLVSGIIIGSLML